MDDIQSSMVWHVNETNNNKNKNKNKKTRAAERDKSANKHKVAHSLWIRLKWFYFHRQNLLAFMAAPVPAHKRKRVKSSVIWFDSCLHFHPSNDTIHWPRMAYTHTTGAKRIEHLKRDEHRWSRKDKQEKSEEDEIGKKGIIPECILFFIRCHAILSRLYQFDLHMRAPKNHYKKSAQRARREIEWNTCSSSSSHIPCAQMAWENSISFDWLRCFQSFRCF